MNKFEVYWDQISQIYFLTKHYLLLAEELSDDFDTFLQPLKEHRDTLDHIVRVYGRKYMNSPIENDESYCSSNMKKALGHAYRAFFDTADWLSYICRQKIRLKLTSIKSTVIKDKYPKYDELKRLIDVDLPKEIANIRETKDISENDDDLIQEVEKYKIILDKVLDSYYTITRLF